MPKLCKIVDCDRPLRGRGLCGVHYMRLKRSGELNQHSVKPIDPPIVRFWNSVVKRASCWEWIGYERHGYGCISVHGQEVPAHRFSFEIHKGPIRDGMFVDHQCRNSRCVNPAHLKAVTPKENNENLGLSKANRSGYRGVYRCPRSDQWIAKVTHAGKNHVAGRFRTAQEAGEAASALRARLFTNSVADMV